MIKDDISSLVVAAIQNAMAEGDLPELAMPQITVERPAKPEHGDYAVSVAMKMARAARQAPIRIAEIIKNRMPQVDYVSSIDVAPPGFINFRLDQNWLKSQVNAIVEQGSAYGNIDLGKGERIQVEFVSANPTGPVTIGGARGACLGDTLANVLNAAGYYVEREYYVNDAGNQILAWNESMWAYYRDELGLPALGENNEPLEVEVDEETGQPNQPKVFKNPIRYNARTYVKELIAVEGDRFLHMPEDEAKKQLGKEGIKIVLKHNSEDLAALGVVFDVWFSEQSLYDSGDIDNTLKALRERGHVAERENAVWFISSALGQDKDNVLIRSNGLPTYFISDIAYHNNKFNVRNFSKVIDIWGADHQGHIPRMKAVMQAIGLNPDDLIILVVQLVSVNGLRMSKRNRNFIPLREVMDVTGADPIRYNMISRSPDASLDFNVNDAIAQNDENPVYYVQYSHARTASIFRRAAEQGINFEGVEADLTLLGHPSEMALIRQLLLLPEVVLDAASTYEVQRFPYYTLELARAFNAFYRDCYVLDSQNLPLTQARLKLTQATKLTLARALNLMGMSAPERMERTEEKAE
ncbi:MAG TPA: arginine--tRNA ligase [Chloroflexia bacterium]|nr:arginine--tRNA ligase [Chloroflexia bacterium]